MSTTHYPPVSEIINEALIPGEIAFLDAFIEDLLVAIRYKDYKVNASPYGDIKNYHITIVLKEMKTALFGTDLELVFFPDKEDLFFSLYVQTRWGIRRYLRAFELGNFSFSLQEYFELLLNMIGVSKEQFISAVIAIFIDDPDPYVRLVKSIIETIKRYDSGDISIQDELNEIVDNASQIISDLDLLSSKLEDPTLIGVLFDDPLTFLLEEVDQIALNLGIDLDLYQLVYEVLMKDLQDFDQKLNRLLVLFRYWMGNITKVDLEYLLIPQFSFTLSDLELALAFPDTWLRPVDATIAKALLKYKIGSVTYSTQTGFHFSGEQYLDFTKSEIGNTGFILELNKAKLDLSRKKNIPEADADGRPVDFVGAYIQEATILLPEKWFGQESGSTLGIFGRDLLIGTGGISGTIGLGAYATEVDNQLNSSMQLESGETIEFVKQDPAKVQIGDEVLIGQIPLADGKYVLDLDKGEIQVKQGKLYNYVPDEPELRFHLGRKTDPAQPRKGFAIGFKSFEIGFQQNQITHSKIEGSLHFPNKLTEGSPGLVIDVEASFESSGDFSVTARSGKGLSFGIQDVFNFTIFSLSVGKDEEKLFLGLSGQLQFEGIVGSFLSDPFDIKDFYVYSDGSFELKGGSIPLPESIRVPIGPTEISVTAIHFGSHEQIHEGDLRKYKYYGLDAAVSVNPGGVDARGDGIKFFFTVDDGPKHMFLKIEGIGVDLVIPGNVSKDQAAIIISGYLSMKKEEYEGSISFILPKANIAGGAAMKFAPKRPAFLIDALLELGTPLILGQTGLGIYGFRGLFGLRYLATKEADVFSPPAETWTDYYVYEDPPLVKKGVHYQKLEVPDPDKEPALPISIGAGLSLATVPDNGRAISMQIMFLLSLPSIALEGKANVLGERVGLTDGSPPFYALLAFAPGESIETGFGVDYWIPNKEEDNAGQILKLQADIRAAYFFKDPRMWFIHIGTKQKPITAEVLSLFTGYSYFMLSYSGIEAGAGISIGFEESYFGGTVRTSAGIYMDVWGRLTFQKPQVGGGIAIGGHVDVAFLGLGFLLTLNTVLTAEAPKPFRVAGSAELCISVKLLVKTIEKCFTVQFEWEKDKNLDLEPVDLMPLGTTDGHRPVPIAGLHMKSGRKYNLQYHGTALPGSPAGYSVHKENYYIPLDTFVELQLAKPVTFDDSVNAVIGYLNNADPTAYEEVVPPVTGERQVLHRYKLKGIRLKMWNGSNWSDEYHPYKAMVENSQWGTVENFKSAYWQKSGKEFNKIRFLANSPFTYVNEGLPGWYVPEQMGLTAATLFCEGKKRKKHCIKWPASESSELVAPDRVHPFQGLSFKLTGEAYLTFGYLHLSAGEQIAFFFPPSAVLGEISIELKCYARSARIYYQKINKDPVTGQFISYQTTRQMIINWGLDLQVITIPHDTSLVDRLLITIEGPNDFEVMELEKEIQEHKDLLYLSDSLSVQQIKGIKQRIEELQFRLAYERNKGCIGGMSQEALEANHYFTKQELKECQEEMATLEEKVAKLCGERRDEKGPVVKPGGKEGRLTLVKPGSNLKVPGDRGFKEPPLTGKDGSGKEVEKPEPIDDDEGRARTRECQRAREVLENKIIQCTEIEMRLAEIKALMEYEGRVFCGLEIHKLCWMSETDLFYNQQIPSQEAIKEEYQLMKDAIEHETTPIWRPNSHYLVEMDISDTVNGTEQASTVYFSFGTLGPIGHFPEKQIGISNEALQTENHPLSENAASGEQEKEAPEKLLKYYIDHDKSYPNTNGRILYAKPLYYVDPKLLVYFKDDYARQFFINWPSYLGQDAQEYRMDIIIKDPTEDIEGDTPLGAQVLEQKPIAEVFSHVYDDEEPGLDIDLINNMASTDLKCWPEGIETIKPKREFIEVVAHHLLPLKLYTAAIRNWYVDPTGINAKDAQTVHKYSFQTSRYAAFKEHIESYRQVGADGSQLEAIFPLPLDLNVGQIMDCRNIVEGTPTGKDMDIVYSDPFDRLLFGCLGIKMENPAPAQADGSSLAAPVSTEFNWIINENTNLAIGLWIRSPEAFNDPRMSRAYKDPDAELVIEDSVVIKEDGVINNQYKVLFSKDASEVFVIPAGKVYPSDKEITVLFKYLLWDGAQYQQEAEFETGVLPL